MGTINILSAMQKDLKMYPYKDEREEYYQARMIYSAMSLWIKTITLDQSFNEQPSTEGVSKIHLSTRSKKILSKLLKLYPQVQEWYYPSDSILDPINIMITRLLDCGELLDVENDYRVRLPAYKEYPITSKFQYVQGLRPDFGRGHSAGLSWLIYNLDINTNYHINLPYWFKPEVAVNYTTSFFEGIYWEEMIHTNDRQYFDPSQAGSISSGWQSTPQLKEGDTTIARRFIEQIQGYSYFAVKKTYSKLYTCSLPNYYKENFEIRRILYALRAKHNNPINIKINRYLKEGLFEVKSYSHLPKKEEIILLALGWPKTNIKDIYNLIFDEGLLKYISNLFMNLGVEIREEIHE